MGTEVCRHGFGGHRRRRSVAWADCPRVAPSTDEEDASRCVSKSVFTKQDGNPGCDGFSHPPVPPPPPPFTVDVNDDDGGSLGIILGVVGGAVVVLFLVAGCVYFRASAPAGAPAGAATGEAPPM